MHVFISSSSNNSTNSEILKILSKLFHNALRSGSAGANVTSRALRDVFQIARIFIANKLRGGIEKRATTCASFSLPDWFLWNARQNLGTISNKRLSYILCRTNVIQKLMSIDVNELASIRANFF